MGAEPTVLDDDDTTRCEVSQIEEWKQLAIEASGEEYIWLIPLLEGINSSVKEI